MENREILFRGKSQLGLKPWVTGFLLIDEMDNCFIAFKPTDDNFQLIPVFEESVGQYTGFNDASGIKVFEGDLIDSCQNDYSPTEVYFDNELGCWATQNYHSTLSYVDSMNLKTKIVGNKFDNPEML